MLKLEPVELYDQAIIGNIENNMLYDYDLIISLLTDEYMRNNKEFCLDDAVNHALEWFDYNIIRSLCYLNENEKPIIIKKISDIDILELDEENEYIKFNNEFWIIVQ